MTLRLTDLSPRWLRRDADDSWMQDVPLAEAHGVMFLCPKCFEANGRSPIGVHSVICWRPSVPQTTRPTPGRWEFQGSSFEDLTLVAGSSSVALQGGCEAHFFIRDGAIVMA